MRALLSIHDVMPETRAQVSTMLSSLFAMMPALRPEHITLLVVPGRQWQNEDIQWLQQLADRGHPLAGHGWDHCARRQSRSPFHYMHALLLSRDAAEHLSRTPEELQVLVMRCHAWFRKHGLPVSALYVPPAWAAGCISRQQLSALPFSQMETLSGVINLKTGRRNWLPLLGYEADNGFRALCLKITNGLSRWWAARWSAFGHVSPIMRIALHPFDFQYRLAGQILVDLKAVSYFHCYSELLEEPSVTVRNTA
ncbi:MAG: DUF2334 domain-containing protein [Gammaproteobacteria bacterium HGW-Gammaproteobacteria-14]|nr:MAG: DUF2334 domain-containing protein [Gammaproteobacteria bacterium HGW-Gammaproteobacteria-14]